MIRFRDAALDKFACGRDAIHAPGAIQPSGVLLGFCPETGRLVRASDNLASTFGAPAASRLGCGPGELFAPDDAGAIRATLAARSEAATRHYRLATGAEVWIAGFWSGGRLVLEISRTEETVAERIALASAFATSLDAISRQDDATLAIRREGREDPLASFARFSAERFRTLAGHDRVMVYRFDTDLNGRVIAEATAPDLDRRFLGLVFPASGIPASARALFRRNRLRAIGDVDAAPVPILALAPQADDHPLDLSDSQHRAVAPGHLDHLARMGVRASMTLALIVEDRLWGLIACHNLRAPHPIGPARRAMCRSLADAVADRIAAAQRLEADRASREMRRMAAGLGRRLAMARPIPDLGSFMSAEAATLTRAAGCAGLALIRRGETLIAGGTPARGILEPLVREVADRLDTRSETAFATAHLSAHFPALAGTLLPETAGLVAVRRPGGGDLLLGFRPAAPLPPRSAGDPDRFDSWDCDDTEIPRRRGYATREESRSDRATPWHARDIHRARLALDILTGAEGLAGLCAGASAEPGETAVLADAETLGAAFEAARIGTAPVQAMLAIRTGETGESELRARIEACIRRLAGPGATAARIGPGSYAVACSTAEGEATLAHRAREVVEAVEALAPAGHPGGAPFCSVGIALDRGGPPAATLDAARIALDAARRQRIQWLFHSARLEGEAGAATTLGEELERGLEAGQIVCHYQPAIDAQTLHLAGLEALVRWRHPDRGLLPPAAFLPLAEERGLIDRLDALVLETVFADLSRWRGTGFEVPRISINVATPRLRSREFLQTLRRISPPRGALTVELAETVFLDRPDAVVRWNIEGLREIGVGIAVDDFGTGRSSLVSLVHVRPDTLKVDPRLIAPVPRSEAALSVVEAIVEIGATLGITVAALGVESMTHAGLLRDIGVTALQGAAFAMPMDAAALPGHLRAAPWLSI